MEPTPFPPLPLHVQDEFILRWQQSIRILPEEWQQRLISQGPFSALQLVEGIEVQSVKELHACSQTKYLQQIHSVSVLDRMFSHEPRDTERGWEIQKAPFWPQVTHLELSLRDNEERYLLWLEALEQARPTHLVLHAWLPGDPTSMARTLLDTGILERVTTLRLKSELTIENARQLVSQPTWQRIERLSLENCWNSEAVETILRTSPRELTHLSLRHLPIDGQSIGLSGPYSSLMHLGLYQEGLRLDQFNGLEKAVWPSLRSLSLPFHNRCTGLIERLLEMPWLPQLTRLDMRGCGLNDRDAQHITRNDVFQQMELRLEKNQLSETALTELAKKGFDVKEEGT